MNNELIIELKNYLFQYLSDLGRPACERRGVHDPDIHRHPEASKALKDSIKINNFISFASVGSSHRQVPPGGVQPVIMNGDSLNLSDLYPPLDPNTGMPMQPAFGQYFVLEPQQDNEARMAADPLLRPNLNSETLEAVVAELRDSHPFSALYKTAGDMHKEWRQNHPGQVLPAFEWCFSPIEKQKGLVLSILIFIHTGLRRRRRMERTWSPIFG